MQCKYSVAFWLVLLNCGGLVPVAAQSRPGQEDSQTAVANLDFQGSRAAPAKDTLVQHTPEEDTPDKDYAAELPRFAPLSPEQALRSFDVASGFHLELVASEPLVFDPIAFAFDARHRLFVVEMCDYSEQETEHLGRIALLEDTDADGKMDRRSTFVDGLSWPTAIWPWKDGVLVAAAPTITWFRDTDDDGRSDVSEVWFDGFSRSNVQGLVNSLCWGVDGYLHGATSSSGGEIEQSEIPASEPVALGRRDFIVDPLKRTLRTCAGGGQHGLSFNRWGDKFVTSNSDHLQQIIDLEWWLDGHSTRVPLPATRRSIAVDGPQAEVFRASPVEPWRIVRTRLRLSGVAPGLVEGGGRAAGYFTGATGTCIMDSQAGYSDFGGVAAGSDTAIVCDVGSNLVHRKRLSDQGLFWTADRIDPQSELVRSCDTWFRPVQLGHAPDGSLIIADMYREVIEHPKSLPPMIKKHLDLTSGRDRGRIWKLVRDGNSQVATAQPATLTSSQLVANLSHRIAWQRRMASQLLIERQAFDIGRELLAAAIGSGLPEGQILAMHVAHRLGMFSSELAEQLVQTQHERVLQHALRLSNLNSLKSTTLQLSIGARARVQLEQALVDYPSGEQRSGRLAKLFSTVHDPMVRSIVASEAGPESWKWLARPSSDMSPESRTGWIELLVPQWIAQLQSEPELQQWLIEQLTTQGGGLPSDLRKALCQVGSVGELAKLRSILTDKQRNLVDDIVQLQLETALMDPSAQATDYGVLRFASPESQRVFTDLLLAANRTEAAQLAAIDMLVWRYDAHLATMILSRLSEMTPRLKAAALRGLVARTESQNLLAYALEQRSLPAAQVPMEIRHRLTQGTDSALANRFQKSLGEVSSDRQAIVDEYSRILSVASASEATTVGREVFGRVCAQCHRLEGLGNDVGPPLKQLGDKTPQQLLEAILDPNREIDPKYSSYTILLAEGRILTGIIDEESTGQIAVKEAGGQRTTVQRTAIDQIKNSGQSLMPVGLEQSVSAEQMVHLIGFLKSPTPLEPALRD